MTSDAKVGLLLGLVFIFIIAFLINGLPSFGKAQTSNGNELTTTMIGFQNNPPAYGAKERRISSVIVGDDIRSTRSLPNTDHRPTQPIRQRKVTRSVLLPPKKQQTDRQPEQKKPVVVKSASPKFYVVAGGDNLAIIAKKVYGNDHGNKRVNVARIFKANPVLKTPNQIYVGQRLIIPPLPGLASERNAKKSIFSSKVFENVKSIGKRHLAGSAKKTKYDRYVVRADDTLWRIAAEKLGDGSRYSQIAKLNANTIADEDSLVVGMTLKMPAR